MTHLVLLCAGIPGLQLLQQSGHPRLCLPLTCVLGCLRRRPGACPQPSTPCDSAPMHISHALRAPWPPAQYHAYKNPMQLQTQQVCAPVALFWAGTVCGCCQGGGHELARCRLGPGSCCAPSTSLSSSACCCARRARRAATSFCRASFSACAPCTCSTACFDCSLHSHCHWENCRFSDRAPSKLGEENSHHAPSRAPPDGCRHTHAFQQAHLRAVLLLLQRRAALVQGGLQGAQLRGSHGRLVLLPGRLLRRAGRCRRSRLTPLAQPRLLCLHLCTLGMAHIRTPFSPLYMAA